MEFEQAVPRDLCSTKAIAGTDSSSKALHDVADKNVKVLWAQLVIVWCSCCVQTKRLTPSWWQKASKKFTPWLNRPSTFCWTALPLVGVEPRAQIEHTKTKPSSFRANLPPDSYLLEAECGVQTVVGRVHRMSPVLWLRREAMEHAPTRRTCLWNIQPNASLGSWRNGCNIAVKSEAHSISVSNRSLCCPVAAPTS